MHIIQVKILYYFNCYVYLFVLFAVHMRRVFVVSVEAASHTQKTAALRRSRLFLLTAYIVVSRIVEFAGLSSESH